MPGRRIDDHLRDRLRNVEDKRAVFDHLVEAMLAEAQPSSDPLFHEPDWQVWLRKAAPGLRDAAG